MSTSPVSGNGSNPYAALGLTGSGSTAASNSATASAADAAANTAINEQDFLKLMTTQLQDQDPMQPTTNAEFFSQMAQFSTVSGINQLNASFSSLSSQLQASQSMQAASLVGHYVLIPGSQAQLTSSGLTGAVEVPSSGDVKVTVKDTSGATVASLDLGTQSAGNLPFQWNGTDDNGNTCPAGTYTISATVSTSSGAAAANTDVAAQVDSVSIDPTNGLTLNLYGFGAIPFSQVTQII
jgi:flagellar basal-body rod modification protein FlgD